ncbi:MAG TPA: TolC family protein [Longimicrobiales bacterium]|nr:TolC family protein [Longimicrobiales bacterium]
MRPRGRGPRALAWGALLVLLAAPLAAQEAETGNASTYRLSLGDAARLAAERALPVLEARARTEGAEARARLTTAALLPSVGVDVTAGGRTFNTASFGLDFPTLPGQPPFLDPEGEVIGPVRSADVRASVEVPLFDLSAWGRRKSAHTSADAARLAERSVASAAAAGAARAYVATLRSRAEVRAREADLELALDLLDVARGLLDSGVGVQIDVTRAESQVAEIRAQLLAARHRAEASELALRRALELGPEARLELTDELGSFSPVEVPTEEEAVARALAQRSDLDVALTARTAAEQQLSATRDARWPRVSARLDDGYYGERFGHMLNTYTWSLRFSVPVFQGFSLSARAHEQEAQVRELDYRLDALRDDVEFQVRSALLNLSAAQEQAAAAAERERLAELEVEQEEERVRAGVAGTADAVRAAMRLNQARTAHLDALAAVQASRVALAEAMGTIVELP